MEPNVDRITRLHVKGMKCLGDVSVDLAPLTVLEGENGSGKSTILDAFEMLRRVPTASSCEELTQRSIYSLLRWDSPELSLSVQTEHEGQPLVYSLSLSTVRGQGVVSAESLRYGDNTIFNRRFDIARFRGVSGEILYVDTHRQCLVLNALSRNRCDPLITSMQRSLASIYTGDSTGRLLTSQFKEMHRSLYKSHEHHPEWDAVLGHLRLALGMDLCRIDVPDGLGELWFQFGARDVRLSELSNGIIAYLCCYAQIMSNDNRSVFAWDEPTLGLHPSLMARAMDMLCAYSRHIPVVIATNTDRVLDLVPDPAASIVRCELDDQRATRLRRPNRSAMEQWMKDYRGLGHLRSEGMDAQVFA